MGYITGIDTLTALALLINLPEHNNELLIAGMALVTAMYVRIVALRWVPLIAYPPIINRVRCLTLFHVLYNTLFFLIFIGIKRLIEIVELICPLMKNAIVYFVSKRQTYPTFFISICYFD